MMEQEGSKGRMSYQEDEQRDVVCESLVGASQLETRRKSRRSDVGLLMLDGCGITVQRSREGIIYRCGCEDT
jgi:hypothetical protein